MSRIAIPLVALFATPASAFAEPITVGAGLGVAHDRETSNSVANSTIGLFARLQVDPRVSCQLELARLERSAGVPSIMASPGSSDIKQASALVVVDLAQGSKITPTVLAGFGGDRATNIVRDNTYAHGELGVGLELRTRMGLVLGADARVGTRRIIAAAHSDVLVTIEPQTLAEGSYHSVRASLGLRF